MLAGATALNIVTFAPPFMAAIPGLGFVRALTLTQASTASTYLLPGGAAVGAGIGFAMLRGWGISSQAATLAVAVTGVWNQLFMLGAPALALAMLTIAGGANPLLQTVAVIGLFIFVVAVAALAAVVQRRRDRALGREPRRADSNWTLARVRRGPVAWDGEALVRFRLAAIGLLRDALVAADARDDRRAAHGLPRPPRLPAHARRVGVRRERGRGVRGVDARPPARLDPDHARRPRDRRARPHGRADRLRRRERGTWSPPCSCTAFLTIVPTLVLGLIAGRDVPPIPGASQPAERVTDVDVEHRPEERRYELLLDGVHAGELVYRDRGSGVVAYLHTEVDPGVRRRGLGSTLVAAALDDARARGLQHRAALPVRRRVRAPAPRVRGPRRRPTRRGEPRGRGPGTGTRRAARPCRRRGHASPRRRSRSPS